MQFHLIVCRELTCLLLHIGKLIRDKVGNAGGMDQTFFPQLKDRVHAR